MWAIITKALNRTAKSQIRASYQFLREKNLSCINNYIWLNYNFTEMATCEVNITLGYIDNCLYYFIITCTNILIYFGNSTMLSHDTKSHVFTSSNINPHFHHNHKNEKRLYYTIIINRERIKIDSDHLSNL